MSPDYLEGLAVGMALGAALMLAVVLMVDGVLIPWLAQRRLAFRHRRDDDRR